MFAAIHLHIYIRSTTEIYDSIRRRIQGYLRGLDCNRLPKYVEKSFRDGFELEHFGTLPSRLRSLEESRCRKRNEIRNREREKGEGKEERRLRYVSSNIYTLPSTQICLVQARALRDIGILPNPECWANASRQAGYPYH